MDASISQLVLESARENPIATMGELHLALLQLEKEGVPTGLTRQSLTATKTSSQSHSAAAKVERGA